MQYISYLPHRNRNAQKKFHYLYINKTFTSAGRPTAPVYVQGLFEVEESVRTSKEGNLSFPVSRMTADDNVDGDVVDNRHCARK